MSDHGNSNQNKNQHHLYEIWDKQEQETFKYGISDDPIEEDGLSARARQQAEWFNVIAGWLRFVARILRLDIGDRENAKHVEDDYMDAFEAEHGRRPRGTRKRNFKKKPLARSVPIIHNVCAREGLRPRLHEVFPSSTTCMFVRGCGPKRAVSQSPTDAARSGMKKSILLLFKP